jgi:plastocyanin
MSNADRRPLSFVLAVSAAAGVVALLACGSPNGEGNGCQGTGAGHVVDAQDSKTFSPTPLTISKGTAVCWQNNGSLQHTVTATSASPFDSSWVAESVDVLLNHGALYTKTFGNVGNYFYKCSIHIGMTGEVDVR